MKSQKEAEAMLKKLRAEFKLISEGQMFLSTSPACNSLMARISMLLWVLGRETESVSGD